MRACKFAVGLAIVGLLAFASHAWATRIYGASRPGNQSGASTTILQLGTDLKGNDIGDALEFQVKKKGPAVITFSAECSVAGTPGSWVSIQILVNGEVVEATDGIGDAFCAADATTTDDDGWSMSSMSVPVQLPPGATTVQVEVTPISATGWWIGDTHLSVVIEKN